MHMFNTIVICLVNIALFFQSCDAIPNLKNVNGRSEHEQAVRPEKCDFSEFAPVRIKQFDTDAVLKRKQPEVPEDAVHSGSSGKVVVKALINADGDVEKACAVKGEPELRQTAEQAALQWKFKPGYGLAFSRPNTKKNPKNYAEVFIVFDLDAVSGH
jgi:TonB family protein